MNKRKQGSYYADNFITLQSQPSHLKRHCSSGNSGVSVPNQLEGGMDHYWPIHYLQDNSCDSRDSVETDTSAATYFSDTSGSMDDDLTRLIARQVFVACQEIIPDLTSRGDSLHAIQQIVADIRNSGVAYEHLPAPQKKVHCDRAQPPMPTKAIAKPSKNFYNLQQSSCVEMDLVNGDYRASNALMDPPFEENSLFEKLEEWCATFPGVSEEDRIDDDLLHLFDGLEDSGPF